MGQEPEAPAGDTPAPEVSVDVKPQDGKTFDEAYVKELRAEAARWRIQAQQASEKAEEFENQNKSELEKAQARAEKLAREKAEAESRLTRFEVATATGLPKELVPRLQGSTREELEADAQELLTLVKNRPDSNNEPDFDGGAREPAPDPQTPEEQHNNDVLKLLGLSS